MSDATGGGGRDDAPGGGGRDEAGSGGRRPSGAPAAPLPTLVDWHGRLSGTQPALFADRVGASGLSSVIVRSPAGRYPNPPLAEVTLQLLVRGTARARFDLGDGRFAALTRPGQFVLAPAASETDYDIDAVEAGIEGHFELLVVGIPAATLAAIADARRLAFANGLPGLHDRQLADDTVVRLAEMLRPDPTNPLLEDASFVDHAGHALVHRLVALAEARRARPAARSWSGGLGRRERAMVLDYIDARLTRTVAVGDLAQLLDRPSTDLTATFRATFGLTPYALVVARRIERAKTLMRLGDLPLAEVALAAGFSSQAHFTTAFRKAVGTTPARWREHAREREA